MVIIVHHLEHSRSQRILWLLEELGFDYEVKRYRRDPKTMLAPPELAMFHPLGKSPILEDDGLVVAESGAIVEYLVAKAGGRLGPPYDPECRLAYRQFLHYPEGSLMPPLFAMLVVSRLGLLGWPARKPLRKMLSTHFNWLDSELGRKTWFAGSQFTAADVMMSFPMETATTRAGMGEGRPNVVAWLERIHSRPAYARALEQGGSYAYAAPAGS